MRYFQLISICCFLIACSANNKTIPRQNVLLFKDKDGVYLFDFQKNNDSLIFKASDEQIFLDKAYILRNDTLTFGIKGKIDFKSSIWYNSEVYYSVDLRTKKYWISKRMLYEQKDKELKIKSLNYDCSGFNYLTEDSVTEWHSSSSSYKGVEYNEPPRFYSKHSVLNKLVFSLKGSIYYVFSKDTALLIQNDKVFDSKFGNGFSNPQLNPTGEFVVCCYNPGFLSFFPRRSLQRIDLTTKKISKIRNGVFGSPTFSNDGKYLLYKRNSRSKKDIWISDIYVMDLETKKETKIGEADMASWRK